MRLLHCESEAPELLNHVRPAVVLPRAGQQLVEKLGDFLGIACTRATRDRCLEVFHVIEDRNSVAVDGQCVGSNGCYTTCAAAGAYFDGGKMVVDYWKKQSLP